MNHELYIVYDNPNRHFLLLKLINELKKPVLM